LGFCDKIKKSINKLISPSGKYSFIDTIPKNGKVLDVGCGNDGPDIFKKLRPDIYYVGIDVGVCNQSPEFRSFADEFIISAPSNFHSTIHEYSREFDAVICSHNLEHCDDYQATILAITNSLKIGARVYFSFPCEDSTNFPSRAGCLNFFDDSTHKNLISYSSFISTLKNTGMDILFSRKKYRPPIPSLIGLVLEPLCRVMNWQAPLGGTWALYGFETIVVCEKK